MSELYLSEIEILKEKNRISRDLHDDLGPILSISLMELQKIERGAKDIKKPIEQLYRNIQDIVDRLYFIVEDLSPDYMRQVELGEILQKFFDQCRELKSVAFEIDMDMQEGYAVDLRLQVYRIVQEIVFNSIKHAEASLIKIIIKEKKNELHLYLSDNGKGFDTYKNFIKGRGISSIRDRVQLLKGRMNLEAEKDGCYYLISIPVVHEN